MNRKVWSLRGTAYVPGTMHAKSSWDAVKISGGKLRLLAKPFNNGENFINGHIGTEGTFQFTYGYVEARMRFHPFLGSHSALWLQTPQPYAVNRPEIDVAEYFGVKNPERKASTNLWHNVYYRDDNEDPLLKAYAKSQDTLATRYSADFHTYGCLWTPEGYEFFIDDKSVWYTSEGASDTEKYLILSILTRDYETVDYRRDMEDTYKLSVDWVRVWK